jgi:protein zwilch
VAIRSNIVNIPTNNNRTAELIRDLSQQRLAIPNLTGTEPLELLLEIGIEKLMKDYQFIFTESKICSLNGINFQDQPIDDGVIGRKSLAVSNGPEMARKTLLHSQNNAETSKEIVGIRNSRFDENLVDFKISKLAQIHLLVQHLLMIQNNLNLENDYGSIARKVLARPLASFDALSKLQQDKLELPILCKKANELVENFMPSAKKISLRSETKFKKVENIFYFNVDMILPPCVLNREEVEEDLERNDIYHFFHALKMSTVAF